MQTSLKPLNQQVVVITGASSGIGLATAMLAAERGAKLVLIARSAKTLNTTISKLAPSLGDKMSAKRGSGQRERIPPLHPQGTLYEPGESGSAHGHASS